MAGNLQAAARPGLAAGNDAQHNKVLQKQRAIKNTAKAAGARGGGGRRCRLGSGGGWRRTPALRARLIGRENAAPWRRGKARSSLRGLERVHARGQRCRAGRRSTAASPPRPRRAPAPPSRGPPKPVRACAGGAEPRRAGPGRAAPPGLAIRRRAAPPAGLEEEEEALCSSPGSRRRRRAPGSVSGSGAGLGLRRLG
ncbi:unnamed protein product [Bubo scandiacus]